MEADPDPQLKSENAADNVAEPCFFYLPNPDPLVRGTDPDPDPSIIKQK